MRAEIISIGTELLVGSILNTNTQFLSQKLAENAIDIYHHTTVGDNPERIIESLKVAASRADLVITSGGLGPTEDDITAKCLAKFLGKPLALHRPTYRAIVRRLKIRGHSMTRLIARQCYVPGGAAILPNETGTAPGILCQTNWQGQKKWVLLLPGPPRELQPMFTDGALPLLRRLARLKKEYFIVRSVKIAGLIEAQVAPRVTDLLKLKPPLTVGIYAKPGEVELKIMAKSASKEKARQMAARVEHAIKKRFKEKVYGVDAETLSSAVGALLREKRKTLAVAESCTGGLFSNLITETPGSSAYFLGGVIAYSDKIKTALLNIDKGLIKKYGAVSAPAAKKMAQNIRALFQSDFGIGITGIAGPTGGTAKKQVGLVYIALADKKKMVCFKNQFFGNRGEIKSRSADRALDILRLELLSCRSAMSGSP